ncbi:A24 family peptidase [Flexibacterium corallicola]|uniref:A24 family peptidase n=1 Tax=Flexibacterium corallicola TaxID=3037259 RepID=UPI00286F6A61|nr:prepilin peptidase [Pseudovibrio sp. M1P-2-3]
MVVKAVLLVFPFSVILAAFCDLFTMKVPNYIPVLLSLGFVVAGLSLGIPWMQFAMNVAVACAVLLVGVLLFAFGVMGGGDAKLAAGIVLWLGLSGVTLEFLLLLSIYGGLLTLALLACRYTLVLPAIVYRYQWSSRLLSKETGIPYAITMSVAALQVYPRSMWFEYLVL